MSGAAPRLKALVLGTAITTAAVLWGLNYFFPVQTSALGGCPLNVVAYEQLHIVITRDGDRLRVECMYIGTRGTYGKGRR